MKGDHDNSIKSCGKSATQANNEDEDMENSMEDQSHDQSHDQSISDLPFALICIDCGDSVFLNLKNQSFICIVCTKENEKKRLSKLTKDCPPNKTYTKKQCRICQKSFSSIQACETHMTKIHDKNFQKHSCETCGKQYQTVQSVQRHIAVFHKSITFNCDICLKIFKRQDHLKSHKKQQHIGGKILNCSICSKNFKQVGNLNVHYKTHAKPLKLNKKKIPKSSN